MKPSILPLLTTALLACASGSNPPSQAQEAGAQPEPKAAAQEDEGPPPFDVAVQDWEGPVGEEGQVIVTVKARDGFKINAQYPHKVSLEAPPDGLSLPMTTITKADAQLNGDQSITYTIPATAAKSGEYKLVGQVKLSVCNKEQCRMAKEALSANVTAH